MFDTREKFLLYSFKPIDFFNLRRLLSPLHISSLQLNSLPDSCTLLAESLRSFLDKSEETLFTGKIAVAWARKP